MSATTTKIPLRSVSINQAEGPTGALIKATVTTFAAASIILARICAQAPKGTYWKVDTSILWADGKTTAGRFDATNPATEGFEGSDFAASIRKDQEFLAGYAPGKLDQATYEHRLAKIEEVTPGRGAAAREFLMRYSLKDDPNAKPAEVQVQGRETARRHVPVPAPAKPAPAKPDTLTYTQRDGTKIVHERVKDPAPLVPQSLTDKLATLETMLAHTLQEAEKLLPVLLATKTADRAQDVATYTKAKARSLEIRKALAAVIKARE